VRAFDERMGWAKWSFRNCAEWLAWRCGLSLSAAREKVRTAHALRELPAIAAAFADGRLSYSKVRALTLWRNAARGVMTISVEVPLDEGEVIAQALERAVAGGEAAMGIEFAGKSGDHVAETDGNSWRAQQADALVAIAKAYLAGGEPSAEGSGGGRSVPRPSAQGCLCRKQSGRSP
jgi:hypothetical protein